MCSKKASCASNTPIPHQAVIITFCCRYQRPLAHKPTPLLLVAPSPRLGSAARCSTERSEHHERAPGRVAAPGGGGAACRRLAPVPGEPGRRCLRDVLARGVRPAPRQVHAMPGTGSSSSMTTALLQQWKGVGLPRCRPRCCVLPLWLPTSTECCTIAEPPTVTSFCYAGLGPRGCVLRGRAASCAAPLPASLCFSRVLQCAAHVRTCMHPVPAASAMPTLHPAVPRVADRHCQAPAVQAVCLRLPAGAAAGADPPAAARCGLPNVHNRGAAEQRHKWYFICVVARKLAQCTGSV